MHGETLLNRQDVGVQDRTTEQKGFAVWVKDNSRVVGYEVTADATGLTGRAGLGLVAATAKAVGLTSALSEAVGGARSWVLHDPGKVLGDIALTLADGGDALRHMADGGDALRHMMVIDRQPVLCGTVASPASSMPHPGDRMPHDGCGR